MTWTEVAAAEEIRPGKPKLIEVKGKEIGLFRENDRYYAVLNVCPHAQAEICKGKVEAPLFVNEDGRYEFRADRKVLRCPWHHWEFELETGKAICGIRQRLRVFKVQEEHGKIYVDL